MSHRVSLLQQDLLQMLHLEYMEDIRPVLGVLLTLMCVQSAAGEAVPVCRQHISGPSVSQGESTERRGTLPCCLVWAALPGPGPLRDRGDTEKH